MLYYLLTLASLAAPCAACEAVNVAVVIERNVDDAIAADSLAANTLMLVPYQSLIEAVATQRHLPPALIAAIVQEESRFNPWAERTEPRYLRNAVVRRRARIWAQSHALPTYTTELYDRSRSMGLMQVMGEVAREQQFDAQYLSALFAPRAALDEGALLLSRLLARTHGDTLAAISAYNRGSSRRIRRASGAAAFANARYVYRVLIAWRAYDAYFAEHAP